MCGYSSHQQRVNYFFTHSIVKIYFSALFRGHRTAAPRTFVPSGASTPKKKMLAFFLLAYKMTRTAQHNSGNENNCQTIFLDFYILWLTCAESGRGGQVWRSALWRRAEMRPAATGHQKKLQNAVQNLAFK